MDVIAEVQKMHKEFVGKHAYRARVVEHEGVTFYSVGQNASHDFFIGTKEGKRFILSVANWEDGSSEEHSYEVDSWNGKYLGHY